jgi:hypothetical protein
MALQHIKCSEKMSYEKTTCLYTIEEILDNHPNGPSHSLLCNKGSQINVFCISWFNSEKRVL